MENKSRTVTKKKTAEGIDAGRVQNLLAAALAFAGTWGCLAAAKFPAGLTAANSAVSVFMFALFWLLCRKAFKRGPYPAKTRICAAVGGLLFGVFCQWGKQLDLAQNVDFKAPVTWLSAAGMALFAAPVLALCFTELEGCFKSRKEEVCGGAFAGGRKWLLTALGLFLLWLPVFLAVYPGFFAYDATDELSEVLTGNYVTRHPLAHVLLLGKTVAGIGGLTGSYNAGIAVYVAVQMSWAALLLSWVLQKMEKLGAGKTVCRISFLFLGLFPVIPMYVLCTSKDMPYTAGMLAAMVLLFEMTGDRKQFFDRKGSLAGLGAALFVTALFRNNGFIVFVLMIPVLLLLAGKGYRKKMGLLAALVLVLYGTTVTALNSVLKPVDTGVAETFTVPIQQLARTYAYSPEVFGEEDRAALFEILPEESLKLYTPKLSDLVKAGFVTQNYEKDPAKYQSLWIRTGLKAPFTYLNAWLMTSYGFWYPDTVIDVYNGWRNYEESSYFSFETEPPGQRESRFPWLEEQYRKLSWENGAQKIPVLSMLFSPGFLCWIWLYAGLYLIAAGRAKTLLSLLPAYLNWLTVLLGPTYLVRYVLIFWFALPFLAAAAGCREAEKR